MKSAATESVTGSKPVANLARRMMVLMPVGLVLVLAIWLGVSTLTGRHFQFDYQTYGSVAELEADADAIVVGKVVGVEGRFIDRGGDPEMDEFGDPIPGIPMIVYIVAVSDWLTDKVATPETVLVAMADLSKVSASGVSDIDTGDPVLLFLLKRTPANAPDIKSVADTVWVPLSGDFGIFDVQGDTARPRADGISLTADGQPTSVFTIAEIAEILP